MNGHNQEETRQDPQMQQLEERIARVLHEQAEQIHYTPVLRENLMQRVAHRQQRAPRRFLMPAFAILIVLVLTLSSAAYLLWAQHPAGEAIQYKVTSTLATPTALAHGGHPISLDPTGHYLLYAPASQTGILYTMDLANPIHSNFLAMRYARDSAWAPDGSALVATVSPEGTYLPLLALVPTGKYMHLIGHDALTASWLPTSKEQITYVTQEKGQPQLWSTTPDGKSTHLLADMNLSVLVQHLVWSHDGQKLAMIATVGASPSVATLSQPGRAVFVMNSRTGQIQEIVTPGAFSIGNVAWSPDGRYLTYEQVTSSGKVILQTIDAGTQKPFFTLTPGQSLNGWSWSPNSKALIYSDGGKLHIYTLQHSTAIQFPQANDQQVSPFWLQDGRILCVRITNGIGSLEILTRSTK